MKTNKPQKLRLVFDAAAEVNGVSLNSYLLKGPQGYQPLPSVLFNFREGAVAVCGDIKEMFHQIGVRQEDRCAQRFLWRDGDDTKPPDVYEMLVMTFGAACSPCAAQHVKVKNALEHSSIYNRRAVKAIESVEQAIGISTQVREIHKAAGFELRNFSSNSEAVIRALKCSLPANEGTLLQAEKVLGMFWQPYNDEFQYKLQFHRVSKDVIDGTRSPTKRELLSIVMSVFDPLGFLSPFVVAAKLVMREVWRSEDAMAALAYWRATNQDDVVEIAFICAKTKCSPLKSMTVPRIELQAAVLGSRLMKTVLEGHSTAVTRKVLWSDSSTVIKWIWRWVPTTENAADDATRAKSQIDFSPSSRWLKGPPFLCQSEKDWPVNVNVQGHHDVEEELRPKFSLVVVGNSLIDWNRSSSSRRIVRTMAWVLRVLNRNEHFALTVDELDAAEKQLCRQAQREAFSTEISLVQRGLLVPERNELFKLMPYLDEEDILRVYGRLDAASWLTYAARRPIIFPSNHRFTTLVVAHYHDQMMHQNTEAAICEVRQRYWVPRLRQVMRKVIANCRVCKHRKVTPIPPLMGALPEDRVIPYLRPFSYTGLDYFGPLTISIGRRVEKRWIAPFTCLTVRRVRYGHTQFHQLPGSTAKNTQ